ncbi:MAG TPA: NADH-quinone oxidoreductase subunit C [Candidatus Omnitrophota bacterium]|nr:NADH-quinone oxidoreductase subunit C [Candidatus Omnitrophota bacterium]
MAPLFLSVYNGQNIPLSKVPVLPAGEFRQAVLGAVEAGGRIISFFGNPSEENVRLYILLAHDREGRIGVLSVDVKDRYPALTPECPQAHWFEREIAEQWGVLPEGHPWLKPIRFHPPYRQGKNGLDPFSEEKRLPSVTDFFQLKGDEIHEVAVGPVHAGIIEPGHFRFQCYGEHVFHLEISLGYQHRGVERALRAGPDKRTIHYMETLAGDTSIGHTTAYCETMEALMRCDAPIRAQALRGIALELERLANHSGDLGALANDIGYLPTASYCGRIRGDFLNMTALICGNRFGRNFLRPGGAAFDLEDDLVAELSKRLKAALRDVTVAVNLLWDTPSVLERLEGTGIVTREIAQNLGLVGVAARACGIDRDVRFDFPSGIFRFSQIPVSSSPEGDVFARAYVRWMEIQRSMDFIQNQLRAFPDGQIFKATDAITPEAMAVSLAEGWRGEICHVAMTDRHGKIAQYKITDPSFHNWMGLAMALRDEQISNFPLCNKSFDLSYCGHDL